MMQPLALGPAQGVVRAGQNRGPNARSLEAFAGYAEARWRCHIPQRAGLDPKSHRNTLAAVDAARWQKRTAAANRHRLRLQAKDRLACEVPLDVSALFRERTFFTRLLWEVVHERKLNERTGRCHGQFSSRAAQIGDRERDDLGGGAQVCEAQVLVGIVRVGLED